MCRCAWYELVLGVSGSEPDRRSVRLDVLLLLLLLLGLLPVLWVVLLCCLSLLVLAVSLWSSATSPRNGCVMRSQVLQTSLVMCQSYEVRSTRCSMLVVRCIGMSSAGGGVIDGWVCLVPIISARWSLARLSSVALKILIDPSPIIGMYVVCRGWVGPCG